MSDNTSAAKKLIEELIMNGCRKIAYLGGKLDTYINAVRYKGYQDAMEKYSLDLDDNIV